MRFHVASVDVIPELVKQQMGGKRAAKAGKGEMSEGEGTGERRKEGGGEVEGVFVEMYSTY